MTTDDRANIEALPAFDDPHVQIVYRILCDTDLVPPPDEHWEGFTARHVVAALAAAQAASAEPVAQDANAEIKALYVQHFGSDRGWLDHDGSFFIEGVRVGRTTPAPAVAPAAVTEALRKLVEMARTSGDDAEPDAELMAACDEASDILATRTPEPAAVTLRPMQSDDGRPGYYADTPEFYCDFEQDENGEWSAFFRDRATGKEAFATRTPEPQAERDDYAELREFAIAVEQALEPHPSTGGHIDRIKALVASDLARRGWVLGLDGKYRPNPATIPPKPPGHTPVA